MLHAPPAFPPSPDPSTHGCGELFIHSFKQIKPCFSIYKTLPHFLYLCLIIYSHRLLSVSYNWGSSRIVTIFCNKPATINSTLDLFFLLMLYFYSIIHCLSQSSMAPFAHFPCLLILFMRIILPVLPNCFLFSTFYFYLPCHPFLIHPLAMYVLWCLCANKLLCYKCNINSSICSPFW